MFREKPFFDKFSYLCDVQLVYMWLWTVSSSPQIFSSFFFYPRPPVIHIPQFISLLLCVLCFTCLQAFFLSYLTLGMQNKPLNIPEHFCAFLYLFRFLLSLHMLVFAPNGRRLFVCQGSTGYGSEIHGCY